MDAKPLNSKGMENSANKPESPLEKAVQAGKPLYHPTDAEHKMRWDPETGIGYIDVGGGSAVPDGYSIELNDKGENRVHYYRD